MRAEASRMNAFCTKDVGWRGQHRCNLGEHMSTTWRNETMTGLQGIQWSSNYAPRETAGGKPEDDQCFSGFSEAENTIHIWKIGLLICTLD